MGDSKLAPFIDQKLHTKHTAVHLRHIISLLNLPRAIVSPLDFVELHHLNLYETSAEISPGAAAPTYRHREGSSIVFNYTCCFLVGVKYEWERFESEVL